MTNETQCKTLQLKLSIFHHKILKSHVHRADDYSSNESNHSKRGGTALHNLIDELRTEHLDLSVSFGNLRNVDLDSEESRSEFKFLKKTLLEHLRKENEELYPKLREAAFNNIQLQRTIEWFTRDVARTVAVLILFLDTYAEGGIKVAYMRDFNRLNTILNALIKQEETIIYEEFLSSPSDKVA